MNEQKAGGTSLAALFFGLIFALGWIIMLSFTYSPDEVNLIHTMTTGAMGAVGASLGVHAGSRAARSQKDKLDAAEYAARHDSLTGLTNRAELFRLLDQAIVESAKQQMVLGVLFLDLDGFKHVNDSMGHDAGDELLRVVADRLRSTVRSTDVVARLGGDEFVVVCRGLLDGRSVEITAQQILRKVRHPIALGDSEHRVSTSIGVAIAEPGDERNSDELVGDADLAMYQAKSTKAGYLLFTEQMRNQGMDRLEMEKALSDAIESNQIVVFYQPIVNTRTKSLYGFEALVRWKHPHKGMIPPDSFVPLAEEVGLMGRMGNLVLKEACAQAAVWSHAAPAARKVRMGVNLAEQQLTDPNLVGYVADLLKWSGIPASQLVLEITENVIVDHLDGLKVLRDLRDLGVSLAIDDFGTGQSSLSYLKQFDMVSKVKIDKTFVQDMAQGNVDQAIIQSVVAMASVMELDVVAEGVETEDQMNQLSRMGVDLMQGYLFERPVSPDEIDPRTWFASSSSRSSSTSGPPRGQGRPEGRPEDAGSSVVSR